MSEYKQQLSAFLDGELSDDEIRRLLPNVEAAEFSTSSRYQLMTAAMRGETVMPDISNQVRVAILQEASLAVSAPVATPAKAGWLGISWLRPAGGLAVAASVALVLVLAVTISEVQSPDGTALVAEQETELRTTPVLAVRPGSTNSRPVANLDSYLKAHSEFAAQDTVQSRMPYARAVTYESKN